MAMFTAKGDDRLKQCFFLQKSLYSCYLDSSFLIACYNICQKSKYLCFINVHVETYAFY